MRKLSDEFMKNLMVGFLKPVLDLVKWDDTLCLQIRNEYINIYYRGGSILKLEKIGNIYAIFFAENYFKGIENEEKNKITSWLPKQITCKEEADKWVENILSLKQIMDKHLANNSRHEKEFQQLVARENNNSIISNDTDYFITDIEYQSEGRFDLIGIKWLSTSQERQRPENCRIAIFEMKYGDKSSGGKSGIQEHLTDIERFCGNKEKLAFLKEETISCFKQLRELGLFRFSEAGNSNPIEQLCDQKPELILILANHKPASKVILQELKSIQEVTNVDIKIATSSFMGYGLYDKNMLPTQEFLKDK